MICSLNAKENLPIENNWLEVVDDSPHFTPSNNCFFFLQPKTKPFKGEHV